MKKKKYFVVELDVALHTSEYSFGSINISNIPYRKLAEIFQAQLVEFNESFLFEKGLNYMIDEPLYQIHKDYLDKKVPFTFDFTLFQYAVNIASIERSDSKKYYHKQQPSR